ncbi:hypothetical protein D0C36_11385 [Mucilaginibacter conchicola]|uniref:Uncharacterized protein n=1 Tax=Mucilaginibacter conchicola TaxID=2303333 RepID=A0A372NSD8_9SPHI|nr:hypothetical protein [Mucilaginibacter conchicola]RFZ92042.1 hypothetical protein D0C36_11385 [Mucilaginibacter conchicola]
MKTPYLIGLLLMLCSSTTWAQTLEIPKDKLTIQRSDKPETIDISINIKNVKAKESVDIKVIDLNSGTAQRSEDYEILSASVIKGIDIAHLNLLVKPSTQASAKTIILKLVAVKDGEFLSDLNPTITLANKKGIGSPLELKNIDSARFTILTAGSLSFYGKPLFSKYIGQLDIRLPLYKKWGLNAGVFTKSFFADSVNTGTGTFNIKKPNDTIFYARNTYLRYAKKEYNTVGAYLNPTLSIARNDDNEASLRLYLTGSLEVLWTSVKTTYNNFVLTDSVNVKYDASVTSDDALDAKNPRITPKNSFTMEHTITGYYGIGPQLIYQKDNLLHLNVLLLTGNSITGGDANYRPTMANASENLNFYNRINPNKFFYLAKGVVTEKVTKLNATIGVEVRGFYPNNAAFTAYLGFLIAPSDFFKK